MNRMMSWPWRWWAGSLVGLSVLVAPVSPARAGVVWCKDDPVYSMNRTLVDATADMPLDDVLLVTGPVHYTIQTPPTVARLLIANDVGFNGKGTTSTFTDRIGGVDGARFLVTVTVSVAIDKARLPAGTTVPLRLTVLPHNAPAVTAMGTTDRVTLTLWITGT